MISCHAPYRAGRNKSFIAPSTMAKFLCSVCLRYSTEVTNSPGGKAYGIPGLQVDGMDVLAVRAAAREALDHCRSGKGPYILEMKTYRYRGHSMSDPAKYRTRDEVDAMRKQHDPIEQLRDLLLREGADEAGLKQIDQKVKSVVSKAADFALASPEPDAEELYTDILLA